MSVKSRCKDLLYFGPRFLLVAFFMLLVGAMVLSNFDLLEPYLVPLHMAQGPITRYGNNITIGHYPHKHELEQLKKERGIDLDISLLDNGLPQERALNEQLARNADKLGIGFKSMSLNYINLNGDVNKQKLAELVKFIRANGSHKVYIHCYLGRHRVKVVHDELVKQGLIRDAGITGGA